MYQKIFIMILFLFITLFANQLELTGKVLDKDNNPVFGVIATLKGLGISDTTGSDGIYRLTKAIVGIKNQSLIKHSISKFENSRLWFTVDKNSHVSIDIFNVTGQKIFTALNKNLSPGNYSINPIANLSSQMLIVQLKIGESLLRYKTPNFNKNGNCRLIQHTNGFSMNVMARISQEIFDTLNLVKDNQILSTTSIVELIDTLPDLFIVQRDIYGDLSLITETVNKIEAVITGDGITNPKVSTLWHNTANNSYSGFAYFVYSISTKNYNVYVKVYNSDNKYIGKSVNVPFTSMAGDVSIPNFNAENARPTIFIGNDTTVSIYDTIHLTCIATDSIASRGIMKWEWNIDGAGFTETSTSDTLVVVPNTRQNQIIPVIRVTDNDGNVAVDSLIITVVQDVPVPTATILNPYYPSFTRDNMFGQSTPKVCVGNTITLHGTAMDVYGEIVKWEWDIGATGTFVTGNDYLTVIPDLPDLIYILRVTDDDGNTALDTITIGTLEIQGNLVKINSKNNTFQRGIEIDDSAQYTSVDTVHQTTLTYNFWVDTVTHALGTYYEAVLYCNALSKSNGLDTAYTYTDTVLNCQVDLKKNGYRILTEAEWEYIHQQQFGIGNGVSKILLNDDYEPLYKSAPEIDPIGPTEIIVSYKGYKTYRAMSWNMGSRSAYSPLLSRPYHEYIIVRTE